MVTPLNFVHFNCFSSSDPFLLIKNLDRILDIREIWFYQYFCLFNNLGGNSDTFLELRDMENIMYCCKSRRKPHSIGHGSTSLSDFIRANISGANLPFTPNLYTPLVGETRR